MVGKLPLLMALTTLLLTSKTRPADAGGRFGDADEVAITPVVAELLQRTEDKHAEEMQALRHQVEDLRAVIDALVTQRLPAVEMSQVTDDGKSVSPFRRSLSVSDDSRRQLALDTSNFHGLRLKSNDSLITMGEEADVKVVRTGPHTADMIVDDFAIRGHLEADSLSVNGTSIHELCNCPSPATPAPTTTTTTTTTSTTTTTTTTTSTTTTTTTVQEVFVVTVKAWTTPYETLGASVEPVMLDFKVLDSWTPQYLFATSAELGEVLTGTFRLEAVPTALRFTALLNDAWSAGRVTVTIDDGEPIVVLCSERFSEGPADKTTGYWVDGDQENGAPEALEIAVAPMCASTVTVTATTGPHSLSKTESTVNIKFLVNGTWTDEIEFFSGTGIGDVETQVFELAAAPTQLALTDADEADMWSFDNLEVDIDTEHYVLFCNHTQDYASSDSLHWVGGVASAAAAKEVVLPIEDTDCSTLIPVTVTSTTATTTDSETEDDVTVRFKINGNWTLPFSHLEASSQEEVQSSMHMLEGIPTDVMFEVQDTDDWGVTYVGVTIDNNDMVSILCTSNNLRVPLADGAVDDGYWASEDRGFVIEKPIVEACSTQVVVNVNTGTMSNSGTTNYIYISFNVSGTFTPAIIYETGTSSGEAMSWTWYMAESPSQLAWVMVGGNAWGFDYLGLVIDGTGIDLSCTGDQTSSGQDSQHWVDGDGGSSRARVVWDVVPKLCS